MAELVGRNAMLSSVRNGRLVYKVSREKFDADTEEDILRDAR